MFGENQNLGLLVAVHQLDFRNPIGKAQRGFERIRKAPFDSFAQHQSVYDDFDRVGFIAREFRAPIRGRQVAEFAGFSVDDYPRKTLPRQVRKQLVVGTFATTNDGGQHLQSRPGFEL